MKLQTEKKIKFWISTIAKILVVVFLLVRIYDYFSDTKKENAEPIDFSPEQSIPQIIDSNIAKDTSSTIYTEDKSKLDNALKKSKETTVLSKIIKLYGKPLTNAEVLIDNCSYCSISTSNNTGSVTITVPTSIYKKNLLHNFYIYSNDSLVFERAMRFADIQFNIY